MLKNFENLYFFQSEKLREAVYAADWLGNKQMMNSILIMLAQKPLVIIACKYATVSIEMFSAVSIYKLNFNSIIQ